MPRGPVHWHEGLFLEPHHLQMMQRQAFEGLAFERRLGRAYSYGLIDCEVSQDELENLHVRLQRLQAVMPSGVIVDVPGNAEVPALDVREAFSSGDRALTVYLGVPLWYAGRANSVDPKSPDPWHTKRHYRVDEVETPDENTGENARPVLVRKVNARLLLEGDDFSDLESLPLLRLVRSGEAGSGGRPEPDSSFVPACYAMGGSPALHGMLQDLANQVEANRRELAVQLSRGGFSADTIRGVQIEQMLRLKTLNRFSARLPALARHPATAPFDVYLELGELLGELAALQPDRDPFELPAYDHDHPDATFPPLCEKIRSLLRGPTVASYLKEAFTSDPGGKAFIAALSEEQISLAGEYYLAIETREDPRAVAKLAEDPDRFKLLPKSLIKKRVRGVRLAEERHPPLEFPADSGLHFFRLMSDESPKIWEQILREKAIGVTWRGIGSSDFGLLLCMTVPEVGE
ncbi:MAG: type VI secretion system baseplate subunit TssK [Planctomycetota bacterium]|jgi:type VI secretion system ImpJ/VasE family protein